MKRSRSYVRPCKGQLDIWGVLAALARYKRDSVQTDKVHDLLAFLLARYGSWQRVAEVSGIKSHLLKGWYEGTLNAIDRDHALHLVEIVMSHRKVAEPWSADADVVRRLPSAQEAEVAHREEQRAWRAYYRARRRGEVVTPPGEKDTSRTRTGRNAGTP